MDYSKQIADQLNISTSQISAVVELLDSKNTVPFIARYRKENTGSLDEEQIRQVRSLLEKLRSLEQRRHTILDTINGLGKLTDELKEQITAAGTHTALEDIYQPYKPKRSTRAGEARKKGLEPLADLILSQPSKLELHFEPEELVLQYLGDEISSPDESWGGARDIVAETISDHPIVRSITREKSQTWSIIRSEKIKKAEDPRGTYQNYYDFENRVNRLHPHQVLAINRGEKEKILRVRITTPERDWRSAVKQYFQIKSISPLSEQLRLSIEDSAARLLLPAVERDVRRSLTENAETHAIYTFSSNLRGLLNQPPLVDHVILGIDPGYRSGCKVAVVSQTGNPLDTATIYPHPPQHQHEKSKGILQDLIKKHNVSIIAIGNGTASRETEQLMAQMITEINTASADLKRAGYLRDPGLHYLIVSEAGASVYSASKLARAELPDMDVSIRGAVSIARRVLDPLAELVKIDPKSIGVGMYQHDVDQKKLGAALDEVVESVVNRTGVDVNSASGALLKHVSGIGPSLAEKIIQYRNHNGPFKNRVDFRKVPGLGDKAFEQSAGFLRIRDGTNPLDKSAIHPESYPLTEEILIRIGLNLDQPIDAMENQINEFLNTVSDDELASQLNAGIPTIKDILEQLVRPGRDPREDLPAPLLRSDMLTIEDLLVGVQLSGTVRNVVDFGAFIDIGIKHDGLLHRSKIPGGIKLSVGEIIEVEILNIEVNRGRVSLGWSDIDLPAI